MQDTKDILERSFDAPDSIFTVKGMIGKSERRMLYAFARFGFEGLGEIIDAGAFIGSSAHCMAAGLIANPVRRRFRIQSYDLFVAKFPDVIESISELVRPIKQDESYLDIYRSQNSRFNLCDPHPGDFCNVNWDRARRIELLFVDVCKSQELNNHVIRRFLPSLIPERSLYIQQDYFHVWHPYVHWSMEILSPYFDIEHSLVDASRVYRLKAPIPEPAIERACGVGVTPDEKLDLLRSGDRGETWGAELADLLILRQLVVDGRWDLFDREMQAYLDKRRDRQAADETPDWYMQTALEIEKSAKWERAASN